MYYPKTIRISQVFYAALPLRQPKFLLIYDENNSYKEKIR